MVKLTPPLNPLPVPRVDTVAHGEGTCSNGTVVFGFPPLCVRRGGQGVRFLFQLTRIFGICWLFFTLAACGPRVGDLQTVTETVPLNTPLETLTANMRFADGVFSLAEPTDALFDAAIETNARALRPEIEFTRDGPHGVLTVHQPVVEALAGAEVFNGWQVQLNRDTPLDLIVDLTAASASLDLAAYPLKSLDANLDASTLSLPDLGDQPTLERLVVNSSASPVDITLGGAYPALTTLAIDATGGTLAVNLIGELYALETMRITGGDAPVSVDASGLAGGAATISVGGADLLLTLPAGNVVAQVNVSGEVTATGYQVAENTYTLRGEGALLAVDVTVRGGNLTLWSR